jgi:acetyl-CoA C-acetyltransferase
MPSYPTGQYLANALKTQYIPVTRLENACATGSDAIRNAAYAVAAGMYDVVLAIGVEKLKDNGYRGLPDSDWWWQSHQNTYRASAASGPSAFAMMASGYFTKYGIDPDEGKKLLAMIEVNNHRNGALNSKAQFQKEVSLETVLNAPTVAWPLGLYDCCGVSDGAAAAIIVRADMAKKFRADPVYIKALQICVGPVEGYRSTVYDFAHMEETARAGAKAYEEAGIKNPREEISMAEVHDCFSITQLVTMEDLQFSPRGKVSEDIKSGFFTLEGGLPINMDGGLKCFGHPLAASGIRMMYEIYKQLQGKADKRQIKNPKLGLTHNYGGIPGSGTCSVLITGNELG